ncbi:MAG TPA: protein kinase [Thermomonospora sp.]|nr:protein kinase [Thermomonospora sp.]
MPRPLEPDDPRWLDEYRLTGRLGEGTHGVVYEGRAPDGTRVAVKALRPLEGPAPIAAHVEAMRRAAPRHIARVLGARLDGPAPYVAVEFIEGPNLLATLSVGPPLAGGTLRRLAVDTAAALADLHAAGLVYGCPWPGDVLVALEGPRLTGFGAVRNGAGHLARAPRGAGALVWIAPEFLRCLPLGAASDIYGWGAIVLFAATGRDLFPPDSLPAIVHRVLNTQPDLSVLPEPLRSLVGVALAKDPAVRPSADLILSGLGPPRLPHRPVGR